MSLFSKLKDTKFRSLKFGQTGGEGDTKPYIVTDLNTVDRGFNRFRLTKFDDGLIRGGAVGAANAALTDTLRIGKFLVDFPKGSLFITKQVGLQLSNPKLETPQGGTGLSGLLNKLRDLAGGPTRIYNLGINTLAQVPVNALGQHIVRHGFLPKIDEESKYINVVKNNDAIDSDGKNNRLVKLYNKLLDITTNRINFYQNLRYSNSTKRTIDDYISGPNSAYGIGKTTIRRTVYTGDIRQIGKALNNTETALKNVTSIYDPLNAPLSPNTLYNLQQEQPNIGDYIRPKTSDKVYNKLIASQILKNDITIPIDSLTPEAAIEKKKVKYTDGIINRNPTVFTNEFDKYDYNLTKLENIYSRIDSDILSVNFTLIDPFNGTDLKTANFSAYISGYSENYNSNWSDIKYNGRSEFFYVFDSYKKTASFKLQIPSFKLGDIDEQHNKLKSIQEGLAGKYLNNRLGGVITRIQLGKYLNNAPCIITSLNVTIPDQASWDIGKQYSMLLEADFQVIVLSDNIPGYVEVKVNPPIPKTEDPKPSPTPAPKKTNPPSPQPKPKVNVKESPIKTIPIDSTRVTKNTYIKSNFPAPKFGGGDFGGGGAGGDI